MSEVGDDSLCAASCSQLPIKSRHIDGLCIDKVGLSRFLTLILRIRLVECCFEHFFKYTFTSTHRRLCFSVGAKQHTKFAYVICFLHSSWDRLIHEKLCVDVGGITMSYQLRSLVMHIIINFNLGAGSAHLLACLIDLSLCTLIYDSIVPFPNGSACKNSWSKMKIDAMQTCHCLCLEIQYLCFAVASSSDLIRHLRKREIRGMETIACFKHCFATSLSGDHLSVRWHWDSFMSEPNLTINVIC